jgi:myosin-crossreactive antigen
MNRPLTLYSDDMGSTYVTNNRTWICTLFVFTPWGAALDIRRKLSRYDLPACRCFTLTWRYP